MVELHGWQAYLSLREQLLLHLEELVVTWPLVIGPR